MIAEMGIWAAIPGHRLGLWGMRGGTFYGWNTVLRLVFVFCGPANWCKVRGETFRWV